MKIKSTPKEAGLIAIKGITAMLPVLGGPLTTVWSDIESLQAKRKQERLEELYLGLEKDIREIKEQINAPFINQPDFLDIFEQVAKHIVNERREEKRILFRNILINSIIMQDCDYDKTERYIRILEQMNSLEILVLRVLQNPEKYNKEQGEIIKDPNWIRPGVRNGIQTSMEYIFLEMLSEIMLIPKEEVLEAIGFLEANRLVVQDVNSYSLKTNGHPIYTLADKLTSKGKEFLSFIVR